MSAIIADTPAPSRLRTYAQLVRLPNVFTALADITLGGLALHALGLLPAGGIVAGAFLLFASACLYTGGMVWNDFFDIEQDCRERVSTDPIRPRHPPRGRLAPPPPRLRLAAAAGCRGERMNWLPSKLVPAGRRHPAL